MVKKKRGDDWFPFWIDKWLFGSTRIELAPDERGVFVDLIALSKKDDGHIRANEGIPYLTAQLCGILNVTEELLLRTIEKCIKTKKIKKLRDGTLYVLSHDVYKLSPRHKRRIESELMSGKTDIMSGKKDIMTDSEATIYNIYKNKIKEKENIIKEKKKSSEKFYELAVLLEKKIKERLPRYRFQGKTYVDNWANTFRIMVEKKEATEDEIKKLILWIFDISDFWYKNILSADKLRKQFGRLWTESGLQKKTEEEKRYKEWLRRKS